MVKQIAVTSKIIVPVTEARIKNKKNTNQHKTNPEMIL